ncbi:hypothetical protein Tco_0432454 [Tanacetum coccineum]
MALWVRLGCIWVSTGSWVDVRRELTWDEVVGDEGWADLRGLEVVKGDVGWASWVGVPVEGMPVRKLDNDILDDLKHVPKEWQELRVAQVYELDKGEDNISTQKFAIVNFTKQTSIRDFVVNSDGRKNVE